MDIRWCGRVVLLAILPCGAFALAQSPDSALTVEAVAVVVTGTPTDSAQAREEILAAYRRADEIVRTAHSKEDGAPDEVAKAERETTRAWRGAVREFTSLLRKHANTTAVLSGQLLLVELLSQSSEDGPESDAMFDAALRMLREIQRQHPGSWQALVARFEELRYVGHEEGARADRYSVAKHCESSLALLARERELGGKMDRDVIALLRVRTPMRVSCLLAVADCYFTAASSRKGEDYDDVEGLRLAKTAVARVLADEELTDEIRRDALNLQRFIDEALPIAERNPRLRK